MSTLVLDERLAELEAEIDADKRKRPASDPFFIHSAWLIAEFREAIRLASREYRSTAETAKLTGWSTATLREKAKAVREARDPGPGWGGLLVKHDAGEFSFCVSTVPVKQTGELKRAS